MSERPHTNHVASPGGAAAESRPECVATNVCLVYATSGRPEILSRTLEAVARQTVQPASIIVSCSALSDAGTLVGREDVAVLLGPKGLSPQRNRALRALPEETDVVVFFDDDFVPHPRWIEEALRVVRAHADVGAVTGHLLADGINGPGLPV